MAGSKDGDEHSPGSQLPTPNPHCNMFSPSFHTSSSSTRCRSQSQLRIRINDTRSPPLRAHTDSKFIVIKTFIDEQAGRKVRVLGRRGHRRKGPRPSSVSFYLYTIISPLPIVPSSFFLYSSSYLAILSCSHAAHRICSHSSLSAHAPSHSIAFFTLAYLGTLVYGDTLPPCHAISYYPYAGPCSLCPPLDCTIVF